MPPLRLHAPGLPSPVAFDLDAGRAALIGRKPLVAALDPARLPVAARDVLTVTVDSPLVSENHLLAWNDGSVVRLLDLRSTNGTRWRLPARREVSAPALNALDIELGTVTSTAQGSPAPAEWTTETEFRESVAREVNVWLTAQSLPASARVMELAPETAAPRDCIALGDGWALRVEDTRDTDGTRTEHPAMGRALEKVWAYVRAQRGEFEVERDSQHDDLVLESPRMRTIHRMIFKAARHGLRGVLQGEPGVGKSRLAECFHVHAERRGGRFVHLNLAEQSPDRTFFRVELFGARKGAATGIDRDRRGAVHAAHGGTLFLDEIGLLPLEVQGLLLTFLDGKGEFHRFGAEHEKDPERADVRVVVGTNTDLREAVRKGTFREDLWWRLAGVVVEIPPLRERREDVRAWFQNERLDLGRGPRSLFESVSPDAREYLLESHTWPGNLRELRSFLERLPIFVEGPVATLAECQLALRMGSLPSPPPPPPPSPPPLSQPPSAPQEDDWADVMSAARTLLPRWLAAHPERQREGCEIDLKVFLDEIVKPLCVARALDVERWDELPRRPVPSFQVLAERIGYGDGKSVQDQLRLYFELKRMK